MPFLANAVYEYIVQGKRTGVHIAPVDIPVLVLKGAVQNVSQIKFEGVGGGSRFCMGMQQ